jgi:predicted  nucleic acid-binding Zn-ribbon protein
MLIDDIRELLAAPMPADARPFLDRVDSTLTAGYAQALQLEAERWRLERRIGEVAAKLADARSELRHEELAALAKRLTAANEDISRLRTLLSSLRDRRTTLRDAA